MKASLYKVVGLTLLLMILGSTWIIGGRAEQARGNSGSSASTTNWVGFLVTGQNDLSDRITRNPSATVIREIEIGLRSDGVVIWRQAPIMAK
jgi:hypothetical protein